MQRTELELGCPGEPPPFGSQPPTSLPTQRRETPRFLSPFPIASPMPVVCRAVPATQAAGPGGLHQGDRAQALHAQTQDIPGDTRAEVPVAPSGHAHSSVGEPGEVPEGAGETRQLSWSPTAPFPLGLGDLGTPPPRPSHPAGSCRRSRDRRCFGTPVGTSHRSVSPAALAAPGTEPGKQPLPNLLCQGWAGHGPLLAGSRRTATSVPKEGSPCCCRQGWHPFGTGPQVGRAPTTGGRPVAEGRVLSGLRLCQTRGQRGSRHRSPLPLSPLPWHLLDGFLFTAASAGVRSSHGLQGSLVTLTLRRGEGISGGSRDTPTAPAATEHRGRGQGWEPPELHLHQLEGLTWILPFSLTASWSPGSIPSSRAAKFPIASSLGPYEPQRHRGDAGLATLAPGHRPQGAGGQRGGSCPASPQGQSSSHRLRTLPQPHRGRSG